MLGAGVFAAIGPAAAAAGPGLLVGLALAAIVAFCNATSSAQLAAVHPVSGGTYAYGRERLGRFWGWLAGWGFVAGKLASLSIMALTFGLYLAPGTPEPLAVAAVAAVAALNYRGVRKTARATRLLVTAVLAALAVAVVGSLAGGDPDAGRLTPVWPDSGLGGVLEAGALLFFAFAGYARIATLGEEVVEPERTIPRAIPLALGVVLAVYAVVAASALLSIGAERIAGASAPLASAVLAGDLDFAAPVVRAGAALAALSVLVSLLAGVGRTAFAMAREGELPRALAAVHPRYGVPHRAEVAVAVVVAVAAATFDLRSALGFSSFLVLGYYAITNAAALTLPPEERRWPRALAVLGLVGCIALALALPLESILAGGGVAAVGALAYAIRRRTR